MRMKILRYPDESEVSRIGGAQGFGVGPHKDYGFLAALLQDDVGGLQAQMNDGTWVGFSLFIASDLALVIIQSTTKLYSYRSTLSRFPERTFAMLAKCSRPLRAACSRPRCIAY